MLKSKIDTYYETHDCSRICQGDIIKDFALYLVSQQEKEEKIEDKLVFPYLVVLTQDCDLEQYYKRLLDSDKDTEQFNQYLPSILVTPAFPAEILREGDHFTDLFNVKQTRIDSKRWKIVTQKKDERYHYLKGYQPLQVPDLIIDFKAYFTIVSNELSKLHASRYLATVNELFREHLSQRFCNYLGRIGLPELA